MRRDRQRLRDILESIERIERFTSRGRAAFDSEELVQVWVVHYLQIIGEAARALSEPLRMKYDQVPWPVIIGMRHILVHDYFGIDLDEVWVAVERDLPQLREQIEDIVSREEP